MGSTRSSSSDWAHYATAASTKPRDALFTTKTASAVKDEYLPKNIKLRESRDSAANPQSTAIILASDVTGSMGMIAEKLIRDGLATTFQQLLERAQVDKDGNVVGLADPHVMCMSVGDAWCDRVPLMVTQFESDLVPMTTQLGDLYIEGGGGGNDCESYNLPWYFAATRTSIDCFDKRGQKGFLFTIGDEPPPPRLEKAHVKAIFGDDVQADLRSQDLLLMVERNYHVFHVIIEEGSHCRYSGGLEDVQRRWKELLGQKVISLSDYRKLPETMISAIEVVTGRDKHDSAAAWSGDTSVVVAKAIGGLDVAAPLTASGGLIRF